MFSEDGCDVEELTFHNVVVPDVGESNGLSLTSDHIDTISFTSALVGLNNL